MSQVNDILNIVPASTKIPEIVKDLALQREAARKSEDFTRSDELRKQIKENGYTVEDTPSGPRIYKT